MRRPICAACSNFKRHGVDHICGYPENGADPVSWTVESLTALRDRCAAQGVSLDMVEFPMLSSASIDNMTAQHDMNPRLVAGLGKAISSGKTLSGSARSSSCRRSSATARAPASRPSNTT